MSWAERLIDGGNVALQGLQVLQALSLHKQTLANEEKLHQAEIKLMRDQHAEELLIAKQTYLVDTFTTMEEHCQELNENLINNSRDAERDMVDQRNQQFFTILLAGTIIFMGVIGGLVQGKLDSNLPSYLIVVYSTANAGSLVFIVFNILLCVEITRRIAKFSVRKSKDHLDHLKKTMNHTQKTMGKIWKDEEAPYKEGHSTGIDDEIDTYEPNDCCEVFFRVFCGYAPQRRKIPIASQPMKSAYHQHDHQCHQQDEHVQSGVFSTMANKELDHAFKMHENKIHKYLEQRGLINDSLELLSSSTSFQDYWKKDCEVLGHFSLLFFYLGTSLMLIATMVLMWSHFDYIYHSLEGSIISVVVLGCSLIACLILAVYLRFFDPTIIQLNRKLAKHHKSRMERTREITERKVVRNV